MKRKILKTVTITCLNKDLLLNKVSKKRGMDQKSIFKHPDKDNIVSIGNYLQIKVKAIDNCSKEFYKYIFNHVGADYCWFSRLVLSDKELLKEINHENNNIYVLYCNFKVAGMVEFYLHNRNIAEIKFFGLARDVIGKKIGNYFMNFVLSNFKENNIEYVHLETCTFDHPFALRFYQKHGFVAYKQFDKTLEIPLTIWAARGMHLR